MKRIAVLVAFFALALVRPALAAETVYISSHTASADTSASLVSGRATLYKIVVSSAGAGSPLVTILGPNGGTLAVLDASAVRDIEYGVTSSSGLVYTTAGSTPPQVTLLYSRGTPTTPYGVLHSTGNYTTRTVRSGRVFLKRVIVGKAGTAPSAVTIYNATGGTGNIVDLINAESVRAVDYNVYVSSGLSYTSTGNPGVTFVFGSR